MTNTRHVFDYSVTLEDGVLKFLYTRDHQGKSYIKNKVLFIWPRLIFIYGHEMTTYIYPPILLPRCIRFLWFFLEVLYQHTDQIRSSPCVVKFNRSLVNATHKISNFCPLVRSGKKLYFLLRICFYRISQPVAVRHPRSKGLRGWLFTRCMNEVIDGFE